MNSKKKFNTLNFMLWLHEKKRRNDVRELFDLSKEDTYCEETINRISTLYNEYISKYPKGLTGFTDNAVPDRILTAAYINI